jgi:hypothetical protein
MAVPMPDPKSGKIEELPDHWSLGPPCVCHHMHPSCSPYTCREAAKRELRKRQLQASMLEEPSVSGEQGTLMESTFKDIRQAAVNGCLTCGILYAGLNAPLDPKTSWIADEKEEDLVVVIKSSTDFFQVSRLPRRGRDGCESNFAFYAAGDSGKLLAHCSNSSRNPNDVCVFLLNREHLSDLSSLPRLL